MRHYAVRDDQWDRIKDILPGREGHVGVTARDNRLFVDAVIYRYRAGIPWRDLPERFGDSRLSVNGSSAWQCPVHGRLTGGPSDPLLTLGMGTRPRSA